MHISYQITVSYFDTKFPLCVFVCDTNIFLQETAYKKLNSQMARNLKIFWENRYLEATNFDNQKPK